jgi:UDP-N-acetylglucosamine 2-epimerase (non-hydrolysing)
MRDRTERQEAVEAGVAHLVGTDPAAISAAVARTLETLDSATSAAPIDSPFGDGRASARIVDLIHSFQTK